MAFLGKGTMDVVIGVALGTVLAGFLTGLIMKRG